MTEPVNTCKSINKNGHNTSVVIERLVPKIRVSNACKTFFNPPKTACCGCEKLVRFVKNEVFLKNVLPGISDRSNYSSTKKKEWLFAPHKIYENKDVVARGPAVRGGNFQDSGSNLSGGS